MFLSTEPKGVGPQREGKKVTNQSVRKTCIFRLLDADVPKNLVAQLIGHKSANSLQSYKLASSTHQRRSSLNLSRSHTSINLQMTLYSTEGTGSHKAINSMLKSDMDPLLSSTAIVFSRTNIGSISGCTFPIFHSNVKIVQGEEVSNCY